MQLINHYTRYSRYEIKGNIHVPLAKRIYYYLLGLLISLWKFAGLFKSIEGSKKQWVLGCKAVYNTSISFVYKTPSDCWWTGFSRITFQPASINVPNTKRRIILTSIFVVVTEEGLSSVDGWCRVGGSVDYRSPSLQRTKQKYESEWNTASESVLYIDSVEF